MCDHVLRPICLELRNWPNLEPVPRLGQTNTCTLEHSGSNFIPAMEKLKEGNVNKFRTRQRLTGCMRALELGLGAVVVFMPHQPQVVRLEVLWKTDQIEGKAPYKRNWFRFASHIFSTCYVKDFSSDQKKWKSFALCPTSDGGHFSIPRRDWHSSRQFQLHKWLRWSQKGRQTDVLQLSPT